MGQRNHPPPSPAQPAQTPSRRYHQLFGRFTHPGQMRPTLDWTDDPYLPLEWMQFQALGDGLIPAGRVLPYTTRSRNLPGLHPHGPLAWGDDSYSYIDNHQGAARSQGGPDGTKPPQRTTLPRKYVAHRSFIPLSPRGLSVNKVRLWPLGQVCYPEFKGREIRRIKAPFFWPVHSKRDPIGSTTHRCPLVWVAGFISPKFPTEGHLVGVLADSTDKNKVHLVEEITKLGAPIRVVSLVEHNPLLTILPLGTVVKHPTPFRILVAEKKVGPGARGTTVQQRFSFRSRELEDQGPATKPLVRFKPKQYPASEQGGGSRIDPDHTPSLSLQGIRDPILLHVLRCLNISAWLRAVLDPGSATFPLYLPVLFALSLEFPYAISSLKEKLEAALALHKDTILQRFPALRSPIPSGITPVIVPPPRVAGSVSGRGRPESSEVDTNLGIPSPFPGEGKVLSLQVEIRNLSPETRTWRYGDEDSLIQLDDQCRSTGPYERFISQPKDQTNLIRAYQPDRGNKVLILQENQNRANKHSPQSEPQITCPIHVDKSYLGDQNLAWGEWEAECEPLASNSAKGAFGTAGRKWPRIGRRLPQL